MTTENTTSNWVVTESNDDEPRGIPVAVIINATKDEAIAKFKTFIAECVAEFQAEYDAEGAGIMAEAEWSDDEMGARVDSFFNFTLDSSVMAL